jgi:Fungal trichothecene efflux pump (TRI12)
VVRLLDSQLGGCRYLFLHLHLLSNLPRIFWINLPLCIPALVGIYLFIHLESEPLSTKERLKRVDWTGIVILTGSLISLLYGITSGGVLHPWDSAAVLSSITTGVFGAGVFLFYESKFASEPMIPLRIFGNRSSAAAYVSSFILGFVLWAMQYYLILYVCSRFWT